MAVSLPTNSRTKYYHFQTTGQGCSNSGPAWCQASDEVFKGVVGVDVEKGVDDCLLHAKTEDKLIPKLRNFFNAAQKGNMMFSRKIQMGVKLNLEAT